MNRDRSVYSSFSKKNKNVYHAPRGDKRLNKELDFPDVDYLCSPTNDTSNNILTYEHIQDVNEIDCSNNEYKPGWVYGSIHSETNKPVWVDKSKTTVSDNSLFDFTSVLYERPEDK